MEIMESNTLLNDQQSQQYGGYLHGVEIVGDTRHVNRIRKLFEHSSVKIKVVQDRPAVQEAFTLDDDTRDTCTEPYTDCGDGEVEHTLSPTRYIYGSSDDNSSGLGMCSHSRSQKYDINESYQIQMMSPAHLPLIVHVPLPFQHQQ
jgi:hypothetical protein